MKINVPFMLALNTCDCCKSPVMKLQNRWNYTEFPLHGLTQEVQMKEMNVLKQSKVEIKDNVYCAKCVKEDLAQFNCSFCGENKPLSKHHESMCGNEEAVCKDCYNNLTHAEYERKYNEIQENHRYD